ncbi:MAG: hypothetical protein ABIN23_08190 [candidate division WOR-3 bacterium]|nr:hypothetical protein [Candidatus Omnitrophota bacterium]
MDDFDFHPWKWAEKALKKFRENLGFLPSLPTDTLTAVLIGYSQEGKTSLALRLLGVEDEGIEEKLRKALRGGRKEGLPATPFPIIYKANGKEFTEEALRNIEEKTRKLREEIDKIKDKDFEEIEIPIEGGIVANVIDLVGLEPRGEDDKTLAKEKARRWCYYADFLIYVCAADHISNFTSYDPEIKEIMDRWEINKETSIFAITGAYETTTIKDFLKKENDMTAEEIFNKVRDYLKDKILKQFRQENKNLTDKDIPKVLPLYLKIKGENKIYKDATKIGLKEIKEIVTQDPLRFKVRAGFTFPRQLEKEIKKKEKELEEKKKEKDKWEEEKNTELIKKKKNIEDQKEYIKVLESKVKARIKILKKLPKSLLKSFEEELRKIKIKKPKYEIGEKVERIQGAGLEYKKEIIEKIDEIVKKVITNFKQEKLNAERFFYDKLQFEINRYLNTRMDKIKKGDVIVKGWFWGVKWDESIEKLYHWKENTYKGVIKILKELIKDKELKKIMKKEVSYLEKMIKDYKIEERNVIELEEKLENEIKEFEEMRKEKNAEIKKLEKKVKEEKQKLEKSKSYKKYLAEEFIVFWNEKVKSLNNSFDFIKILNLLYQLWATQKTLEECCLWAKEEV